MSLLFGACTLDERAVSLVRPLSVRSDAGASAPGAVAEPSAPRLEVSATALDFGPVALDTASLGSVSVSNLGAAPAAVPLVMLSTDGQPDFTLLQNRCTQPLLPGEECQIRINFQPTLAGPLTGLLSISDTVSGAVIPPLEVSLAGLGVELGDLALSPDATSSPNFGAVVIGTVREATFALLNLGERPSGPLALNLRNPEFQLLPPSVGDCNSGDIGLDPGASCNVRVAFAPTRRDELAAATLTVVSTDIGSASVSLTGVGSAPAELEAPERVDFGPIVLGQSGRGTVKLGNLGDEALPVPSVSVEGADAVSFVVVENGCGQELAPTATCDLSLAFTPLRPDEHLAELVLTPTTGPVERVSLLGEGRKPGALLIAVGDEMAPLQIDFGSVVLQSGAPATQSFEITNSGGTPSGALGIEVDNTTGGLFARASDVLAGDCEPGISSLQPGQGCTVRVTFAPAQRGAATGSLTITSDLAGSSGVQMLGTGLSPAKLALVSANLVQFNQVITNSSTPTDITIRNDGDEALNPQSAEVVVNGAGLGQFVVSQNGCTTPLEYQATCTIRVELRPTQAGSHSASLLIGAGAAGTTSVGLLGRAVLPGSLTVTPETASFTALVDGQSEIQTFTVSNPGSSSGPLRFNTASTDFEIQSPRAGSSDCVFNQTLLAEGQSCTVRVLYDPEVRGTGILTSLTVESRSAGSDSVQFTATAQTPSILNGSQSTEFGTVNVGASRTFTWEIRNGGDVPSGALQLSIAPSTTTDFRIQNNGCAASLAPQSSCTLILVFEPKSQNAPTSPLAVTLTLQGTGTPLTLRATGSGRVVQQPGQRCNGNNDASQCARVGDVCSFNHNLGGGGAICCNAACTNPCETCDTTGTCSPRGSGASCGTNAVCSGNSCLKQNAQTCSVNNECASGSCDPSRDICCAQNCGVLGQRCAANGLGCEVIPVASGPCQTGAQCTSGLCVDGVCCNAACNGICEACNTSGSVGTCAFQPVNPGLACSVAGQVCVARGTCAFPLCTLDSSLIGSCVLAP